MKIPKQLKIGGHTYRIIFDQVSTAGTSQGHSCGQLSRSKGTISINATLMQSEKEETLIHEILHGINSELNETLLDSLAQQIYGVLSDNKLLK